MSGDPAAARDGLAVVDRLSEAVGRAVSWLTLAMVVVTCLIVALRYVFSAGAVWVQETVTWMHALVFMLGAAWTLRRQGHVRVDVFYRRLPGRGRAWIDLLGTLLFLLPACGYVLFESLDYVSASWRIRESSREAGGLPGLYLLKSAIPAMAVLLALQGLSEAVRAVRRLRAPPAGEP